MIFDELDAQMTLQTPRDEADRRRMGLSLSLVCRAWRQAGTAFCWRVFTLMARDEDDVDCGYFDHLLDILTWRRSCGRCTWRGSGRTVRHRPCLRERRG